MGKEEVMCSQRRARPEGPAGNHLRMWRRKHVSGLTSEVTPVPGIGTWKACVWSAGAPNANFPVAGYFSLLTDAQEAGDNLARARMTHDCSLCEQWVPIEGRNQKR